MIGSLLSTGLPVIESTLRPSALSQAGATGYGNVRAMSGGSWHSLALNGDGMVRAWGDNSYGQLGDGTTGSSAGAGNTPTQAGQLRRVTQVAAGGVHSLALADGDVWAWGHNGSGRLGDGTATDRSSPVRVPDLYADAIAAGGSHSLAVSAGRVYAWGNNGSGQLGTGTTASSSWPVRAAELTTATKVAAGGRHSLALRSDGTVWGWGYNYDGQTGRPIWRCNGNVCSIDPYLTPGQISGLTGVTSIVAGYDHSLALHSDGTVWAWGANLSGQLGDGTTASRSTPRQVPGLTGVTAIAGGEFHSLALRSDGTLWAWGANNTGQLGTGSTASSLTPVRVGAAPAAVVAIGAGYRHSLAVQSNDAAWAWGYNAYGQLGDASYANRLSPVAVAASPTTTELFGPSNPALLDTTCQDALSDSVPESASLRDVDVGVNCATGNFWYRAGPSALLEVPGRGPALAFEAFYNSLSNVKTDLGPCWTHNYLMRIDTAPTGELTVTQENGSTVSFSPDGQGGYTAPPHVLAALTRNGDGTFAYVRHHDQMRFGFAAAGELLSLTDHNGFASTLAYAGGKLAAVTDASGRSLTFAYEASGSLGRVSDPAGRSVSFSYNANGSPTAAIDAGGGVTRFTYDYANNPLTITDPGGGVVRTTYDAFSRVAFQTDAMGRTRSFTYGPGLTTTTDAKGFATVARHRANRLVSLTRASGRPEAATTRFDYDARTMGVTRRTNADGTYSSATFDARGNVVSSSDELGRTSSATYNARNQVLTSTDALGVTTTFTYNANGNVTSRSRPLTSTGQQATTRYSYDPARPGDMVSLTDPTNRVWTYSYDASGNRVRETDPLGNATTHTYDAIGRKTATVSPKGNLAGANPGAFATTFTYTPSGDLASLTDELGQTTSYTYSANRNRLTVTDANNHTTSYAYNANNEVTTITRPDGSALTTTYDANGNVASRRDGLQAATTYGYDGINRKTSVTDPLSRTTRFSYDTVSNLTSMVDPGGRTTAYRYDTAGQRTSINYGLGTPSVNMAYDALGRRTSMTDGTGTGSYVWDSLGRLTRHTNGAGSQVSYGYDLAGRITTLTYPAMAGAGSRTVSREYDGSGRLSAVRDWGGRRFGFAYDANSNLVRQDYPNSAVATSSYDATNRVLSIVHAAGGNTIANLSYTRGGTGLVTSENGDGFTYDPADRITNAATPRPMSYGYDAGDNLKRIAVAGGETTDLAYDPAHQLTSATVSGGPLQQSASFSYDANGNRTGRTGGGGSGVYAYDQANRLLAAGGTTYAYDGDGLRTAKVAGATQGFTWDVAEGLPLILQDGATSYVTGPRGLPLAQISPLGGVAYYHSDQLGSTRALTDASGAVVATYSYDAYGNVASSTGAALNPFRFVGQYTDDETGFVYLRARYYDPATGQFLTKDPVEGGSCNDYDYACADPINKFDLDGQFCLTGKNKNGTCRSVARGVKRSTKFGRRLGVQVNACVGYVVAGCVAAGVSFRDGFYANNGAGHGFGWSGPSIGPTFQSGPSAEKGDCHSAGVGPGSGSICYGGHRVYNGSVGFGTGGYFHTRYSTHAWKPWD